MQRSDNLSILAPSTESVRDVHVTGDISASRVVVQWYDNEVRVCCPFNFSAVSVDKLASRAVYASESPVGPQK